MSDSPFGTVAVIVAPSQASSGGLTPAAVEAALDRRGVACRLQVAADGRDATRLAAAALDEGFRYLAAFGDDGTVQDVLNGMFRDGRPIVQDSVLAVLPSVGGSDLARSFGLPEDFDGATGHLSGDTTYPFDVMKIAVTGPDGVRLIRYAHNVVEVGLHATAWQRSCRLPKAMGNARRFVGFWSAYLTSRVRDLRIETDTKRHDLRAWSVIVGNGQFAEDGIRLSPRSFPGDGVLDALVFTGPKSDAYRLLPRMFRHGDHVPDPGITELRAKLKVSVEAPVPLTVVADGRMLGTTPVTVQMIPQPILLKL